MYKSRFRFINRRDIEGIPVKHGEYDENANLNKYGSLNRDELSLNMKLDEYKALISDGKESSINYESLICYLKKLIDKISKKNAGISNDEKYAAQKRFNYYFATLKSIEAAKAKLDKVKARP